MKIVFLYSELVGYLMPIFRLLISKYNFEVHVIHWDKEKKIKPYEPDHIKGVYYYPSSNFSKFQILNLCVTINPDIIYISGWMDKSYLHTAKYFKNLGIPIVTGFDDRWLGTLRQKIGAFIFPFLYKKYFSHAWVAGTEQYEFAKKLNFPNNKIIFNLLSANTDIFNKERVNLEISKQKSFLYVGNFRKVKGTDILVNAYKIYKSKYKGQWGLKCVGNGNLNKMMENICGLDIYPFSNEEKLIEIASKSSVFILPSRNDQWGVVVHEFSSLGLPLLLSENVGAKCTFFIEKYNGLSFKNNSADELASQMHKFSLMNDDDMESMSINSFNLSKRISPESSVANLVSIL
tara:strand:+ start:711 stop:1751 length:1041 start_codon:yes stop_codon:yes gene_type:complete